MKIVLFFGKHGGFLENPLNNELLNQIVQPGITIEKMERTVYTLFPVLRLSGKIGGWMIRWHNNKPIISRQATTYNTSQTKESISNRNSFAAATYFATSLNKVDIIKEIWSKAKVHGNCAHRKIISYNKKHFVDNHPSLNNAIIPGKHYFEMNAVLSFNSSKNIKLSASSVNSDETLIVVLVPYNPLKSGTKEFEVITLVHALNAGNEIDLTEEQLSICRSYNKYILYSVIVRTYGSRISWSNTAAIEGEFSIEETGSQPKITEKLFVLVFPSELSSRKSRFIRKAHPPPGILNTLIEAA